MLFLIITITTKTCLPTLKFVGRPEKIKFLSLLNIYQLITICRLHGWVIHLLRGKTIKYSGKLCYHNCLLPLEAAKAAAMYFTFICTAAFPFCAHKAASVIISQILNDCNLCIFLGGLFAKRELVIATTSG